MGSKWKRYKLEDICEGVFDCPHSTPKLSESGPYMVRTQDIRKGFFDITSAVHVSEDVYKDRIYRVEPRHGDLLFSREGTYFGDAAEVPKNTQVCLGQRMVLIRPNTRIIRPKFLRIYINSSAFQKMLLQYRDGTVAERLNLPVIRQLVISVPSLEEQKEVEERICCLEEKITLNRQLNQTLEQMAQALFKSWFVDFDPVIDSALAAGNPIPDDLQDRAERRQLQLAKADHKPLPDNIRKLFPSEFELTESLGWVPKGWGASQIKDFCEKIQNGGTPNRSTSEYWDNGTIPWLTSGEVRQKVVTKTENFITELGLKGSSAKPVAAGSTLIAMYGATAGQVAFSSVEVTTNQAVCALIPKTNCKYFVYLAMERCVASLENQARGSAQQNISKGIIEETLSVMPSVELLAQFDQVCDSFFVSWICNLNMNEELANLRDTLLPKLISGELRIPEAQTQLEEALG